MDIKRDVLVIATAERYINVVKLNDPSRFFKTSLSPLSRQTRDVSCFLDASGYVVASIEGKCSFQYLDAINAR